jgi:hypothetical protein
MSRFTIHEQEEIAEQAASGGSFEAQIDWGLDAHELQQLMNDRGMASCRLCGNYVEAGMMGYDYVHDTTTGICVNCTPPKSPID